MTSSTSTKMKTLDMAYIGLFAVVIAICSWISIPTVVPFTLQTFAVFLAVAVLGGKRGTLSVIVYVLLGAVGLYFLCVKNGFSIQPSDLIILAGTLFWALHILCVGHFAPKVNVIKLTASQFFVAGVISLAVAVFREPISWDALTGSSVAVLYTGVMSTGVAFTLQALGQKHANPTAASIIMSTEGLWAVVFGFLILGEKMTGRELIGCGFMLAAVIISQLPVPARKSRQEEIQGENPENVD